MKDGKKYKICLLVITVMLLCCACKEYVNRGPQAEEMAKEYIEGKYGDVLSYAGIEEMTTGMINGEAYWKVYFTDKEGGEFTVCVCISESDELYIDCETYYIHYIEPMMCDWLAVYLEKAGLTDYTLYCSSDNFSPDWSLDWSVEEILGKMTEANGHLRSPDGQKGWVWFELRIPEREREVFDSGKLEESLSEIKWYSDKMHEGSSALRLWLSIYDNETYDSWDEMEGRKSDHEYIHLVKADANE